MKLLLTIMIVLALVCCFPNLIDSAQKQPAKDLVVGPISVGDLFRLMHAKDSMAKLLANSDGPTEEDILQSLKKTKMWIKDTKERDSGKWSQENPRILLEGPLAFDLKNKKGADFEIWIRSVEIEDISYSDDNEFRRVRVWVRLGTSPYQVQGNLGTNLDMNFCSTKISYDGSGKVTLLEKSVK